MTPTTPETHHLAGIFRDKLVFVGFSTKNTVSLTSLLADHHSTPHVRFGAGQMSGVEIQANVAAGYLHSDRIHEMGRFPYAGLVALFSLMTPWLLSGCRPGTGVMAALVSMAALSGLIFLSFSWYRIYIPPAGIVLPVLGIIFGCLLIRNLDLWKAKTYIRQIFSRYTSPRGGGLSVKASGPAQPGRGIL